eukprot:PhM_4_TR16529/c0_g1_i1/m.40428/K10085/EDEM2; ER degradation enhancer, mannosidase alpha-like 2
MTISRCFYCSVVVIIICLILSLNPHFTSGAASHHDQSSSDADDDAAALSSEARQKLASMFSHAYDNYMTHAFPMDELRPLSCSGVQTLCSCALTLIDSLDTLVVFGRHKEFREGVKWVAENVKFDRSTSVSVFEVNIRVLGGLLSAHVLYEEGIVAVDPSVDDYNGSMLRMAVDLADRLLPAFNSRTGIPYGAIDLQKGVSPTETSITSTAGGGTFLLEFGVLSALTGDNKYEIAARRAARSLFQLRSKLDLVGNHLDINSGRWTHEISTVGSAVDSYFEYLIKGYVLFGDYELLHMYRVLTSGVERHLRRGPWYLDAHMQTGLLAWPVYNSLSSFYPGNLIMLGNASATSTMRQSVAAIHGVWRRYGAMPEGFNLWSGLAHKGELGYPLRPESAESIYMMYRATRDPRYLDMGLHMVDALEARTRGACGYGIIADVENTTLEDRMESFMISETLKYLYLLFDDENVFNRRPFVFTTEAHPFPVREDFSFDEVYPPGWHKARDGTRGDHFMHGFTATDVQCAKDNILDFLSVGDVDLV